MPAAAARGSAALTIPAASEGAEWEALVQPQKASAAATDSNEGRRISGALLGPDSLGNVGEAFARDAALKTLGDPPSDAGPVRDHRRIKLDEARSSADPFPRIVGTRDSAEADQRNFPATCGA